LTSGVAEEMQRMRRFAILISILFPLCLCVAAQSNLPESPTPQSGQTAPPERPKASLPLGSAPLKTTPQGQQSNEASSTETAVPEDQELVPTTPAPSERTLPSNRAANQPSSGYDEASGVIKVSTNAVPVPVTVKDARGHLFAGLVKDNFSVYENGVKQKIAFFSSDPFPVSAAIVIDVGMSEIALRKIKDTFGALVGAFSQFDELSIYTYAGTVKQHQDFLAALGDTTTLTLAHLQTVMGTTAGPAVYNPMTVGPTVNGRVFDQGIQHPVDTAPPKQAIMPSSVLNDAILQAALDLGRREKARRRVIFVLSNGIERGSTAKYRDVLRVLLTNNVTVYGVENDTSALPGYSKLSSVHLPGQGYANILPKYASATGGEIFTGFTTKAVEGCYGAAMEQARSQYTLLYYANATPSTAYRRIEVRVSGYGSTLKVYARDGYYPAPQAQ
jgi:VWFA-related protein